MIELAVPLNIIVSTGGKSTQNTREPERYSMFVLQPRPNVDA